MVLYISNTDRPGGTKMSQPTNEAHSIVVGEYDDMETVAVVVGTFEQAQEVADRWNLDNIERIAKDAGASYARVGDDTVPVHVFPAQDQD
jgi:hypothetical protein